MARLPALEFENLTAEQEEIHHAISSGPRGEVRGPLAIWLYRPMLADKAQQLGQYCRYDSSLPARLSELAILVTARIWQSEFEWQAHETPAREAGLSDNVISSLAKDVEPIFCNDDESVVYRFSRELNLHRKVKDSLYQEAEQLLGRDALVDLVGILGYYSLISMTINVFEVDPA